MSSPPNLEPEYAHEPNVLQFADGNHVATPGFKSVEPHERSNGGDGFVGGGIGRGSHCDVIRNIREKHVAICMEF